MNHTSRRARNKRIVWWYTCIYRIHDAAAAPSSRHTRGPHRIAIDLLVYAASLSIPNMHTQSYIPDTPAQVFRFLRISVITLLKWSMGPKNGLERRFWQFYTICDKNQGLHVKVGKFTAILVLGSTAGQVQATLALRKSLYGAVWGAFRKTAVTLARRPAPLGNARTL
jgi:hypothetical protein